MPTYKDLLGMLRSAISRSVNIIAFDEGEINENGVHEDYVEIVRAVDGPLTTLDGNVQILDESFFEDDEDSKESKFEAFLKKTFGMLPMKKHPYQSHKCCQ